MEMCPLCLTDDRVLSEAVAPGKRQYACASGSKAHPNGAAYVWSGLDSDLDSIDGGGGDGIMADLGLMPT